MNQLDISKLSNIEKAKMLKLLKQLQQKKYKQQEILELLQNSKDSYGLAKVLKKISPYIDSKTNDEILNTLKETLQEEITKLGKETFEFTTEQRKLKLNSTIGDLVNCSTGIGDHYIKKYLGLEASDSIGVLIQKLNSFGDTELSNIHKIRDLFNKLFNARILDKPNNRKH